MRLLVGAACVAIIAAVGYYFWSEYQTSVAAKAAEKERSMFAGCRVASEKRAIMKNMHRYCVENGYTRE